MHKLVQPGSMGSTSDSVKARCKCPCLIVRPAVRPLHPSPAPCLACSAHLHLRPLPSELPATSQECFRALLQCWHVCLLWTEGDKAFHTVN